MNRLLYIILLLCFSSILQAADFTKSNLNIIDKFAIPTFGKLKTSSEQLVKSSEEFCRNSDEEHFSNLKSSFHQMMDAWQTAQILRSGPAMESMRFYRFEMWPDRSNARTKHLRKLQQEANPDSLKAETFAKASTAIQGLSALEYLLYSKDVKASDYQNDGKANFKCQLIQAISHNVETMSGELLNAWQKNYRDVLIKPGKYNDIFETKKSVTAQFLSDLTTQLQVILTQKFKRPLYNNRFRFKRAESWRSERSLRNILLNLQAVKQLYQVGFTALITDQKLIKTQQKLFDQVISLGEKLSPSMQEAYSQNPKKLERWISEVGLLKSSIFRDLPVAIDIPIGFNSLDGDGG